MDCWIFMQCRPEVFKTCPAYPEKGMDCWKVTGTKCDKGTLEKKTSLEKIEHCRKCQFYITHAHKY